MIKTEELSLELCDIIDKLYKLISKEIPTKHGIYTVIDYVDKVIKPELLMIDEVALVMRGKQNE